MCVSEKEGRRYTLQRREEERDRWGESERGRESGRESGGAGGGGLPSSLSTQPSTFAIASLFSCGQQMPTYFQPFRSTPSTFKLWQPSDLSRDAV